MSHNDLGSVFENMTPDELSEMLEKLVLYSAEHLRRHGPRARHYGMDAEDAANEAVMRALDDRRKWPKNLEVKVFLAGVVKSIISHEGASPEHEGRQSLDSDDDEESSHGVHELPAEDDVEAEVLAQITAEEFKTKLEPELRDYVDLRIQYPGSTAEELAEKSKKPVQAIRNLDRKLARRRAQWNSSR